MSIEQDISNLNANMNIVIGRVNAVHTGLLVAAKHMPKESLLAAANEINQAAEAIHADALATPLPEALLDEMQRVLLELAEVLRAKHSQTRSDPASQP